MSVLTTTNHIRILIVDDHAVVRLGVRRLIETQPDWNLCGEASSGREALAAVEELKPDVIIQDITLPDLDGMEVVRQIKKFHPETEIVIFTAHETETLVHQAFSAGARSYLIKTDGINHFVEAVRSASAHQPYFTPRVSEIIFKRLQAAGPEAEGALPDTGLTPREREAVRIIAEGKSNKELAALLGISLRTAESHRAAIMHKLNLHGIGELIRYAIRNGIIAG